VERKQKQMDEGTAVQPSSRPEANSSNNELNTTAPHPTNGYFPSDGPNSGSGDHSASRRNMHCRKSFLMWIEVK
jgi:hypothetical protein